MVKSPTFEVGNLGPNPSGQKEHRDHDKLMGL